MKQLLILFLLCISFSEQLFAQNKTDDIALEFAEMKKQFIESDDSWTFTRVVEIDNKTKDEIFVKALEVLSSLYKDSKEVVQVKDKDAGLITGKGFSDSPFRTINWATIGRNRCWHFIKIEVKEAKFRVTITVNSLWVEQGADLRHPFNGDEHKLSEFYPYWKDCKTKHQQVSFNNLKFAYSSVLGIMNAVEKGITDGFKASDDSW